MRVALLSMIEPATGGHALPRAFLHVGGESVARHQLGLAMALQCQRIICHARGLSAELVQMQHVAENAGLQFHLINGPRQLSALIAAQDEVIVMADGLLADPRRGASLMAESTATVLVLPVESGIAAGFERLDINHASAGLLRMAGKHVEAISQLPEDCDLVSALTRVALQSGAKQKMVPADLREGAGWRLLRNEADAHDAEAGWMDLHLGKADFIAPGFAIAHHLVRRFGPALLHAGSGGNAIATGAGVLLLLAVIAGWFGFLATALAIAGVAWLLRTSGGMLAQVERNSMQLPQSGQTSSEVFDAILDVALVVLIGWSARYFLWNAWAALAFPPIILLGLLRILPRDRLGRWGGMLDDRLTLASALAIAAAFGVIMPAIQIAALLLMAAGIFLTSGRSKLTGA